MTTVVSVTAILTSSSDNDGYSSKDEQEHLSARKDIPRDEIDEQRLLAYKKEDKAWDWNF